MSIIVKPKMNERQLQSARRGYLRRQARTEKVVYSAFLGFATGMNSFVAEELSANRLEPSLTGYVLDNVDGLTQAYTIALSGYSAQVMNRLYDARKLPRVSPQVAGDKVLTAGSTIDKINGITANRITELDRVIRKIVDEGDTLQSGYAGINRALNREAAPKWWSSRIARTEVHNVGQEASLTAAREIGQLRKRWVSSSSERTRSSHQAANGQIRALEEKFSIGIALLDRPGDRSGPASETINCRCALAYIPIDINQGG